MLQSIDLDEARQRLSSVVESIYNGAPCCVLTRDGVAVAVVVGAVDFFEMLAAYVACREAEGGVTVN